MNNEYVETLVLQVLKTKTKLNVSQIFKALSEFNKSQIIHAIENLILRGLIANYKLTDTTELTLTKQV